VRSGGVRSGGSGRREGKVATSKEMRETGIGAKYFKTQKSGKIPS
jgi:hypothetical protein